MKEFIRNFFFFTSRERNGTIILAGIMLITIVARLWIALKPVKHVLPLNDTTLVFIESFIDNPDMTENENLTGNVAFPDTEYGADQFSDNAGTVNQMQDFYIPNEQLSDSHETFFFDPNTASLHLLVKAGFSRRVAETIINYRNSGGKFREVEDIKKIYGLTTQEYDKVKSYIKIENHVIVTRIKPDPGIIELNKADSVSLVTLRGIGPVLASRIIKYRKLLGGFYDKAQLREVYGLSDSIFNTISEIIYADSIHLQKININQTDGAELEAHPYIGSFYAQGIIKYREIIGSISGMDELLRNNLLPENNALKIIHYIDF